MIWLLACADECDGPYARCDGAVAETCGFRWDNELTGHYELRREACEHCQLVDDVAFCALDPAPDAACPAELRDAPEASRCVDGVVVTWSYGYRVATETCGPERCVDVSMPEFTCDDRAFCSPMPAPDPICSPGVFTSCEDAATIVYCACGYRADAHACASPGPSCVFVEVAEGVSAQGACR